MNVWMKKITACVMAAAMLLMAVPTIAVPTMVAGADETAGDFTYQVNGSLGRAIITGYTGNATEVVVPAELGGYPVTSISDDVFENNTQLVRVVLPDSMTSINSLFYGCTSLQSVELPDGLQSIGSYAFYNCTKLSEIELPHTVRSIGGRAFYGCASLTSLVIPEGVGNIGEYAFASCKGLQSVSLPQSLTWIYSTAFSGCSALTKLHIADLTAWCKVGFLDNNIPFSTPHDLYIAGERVEDLVIPEGITRINDYAFAYANIRSLTAPDSVTAIGGGAFYGCELLTDIDLPDTILEIKSCSAFLETGYYNDPNNWTDQALYLDGCLLQIQSGISGDYTVREGTTLIAGYAFSSGGKITGISLPDSVVAVGEYAFDGTAYYRNSENWTNDCLYIDHCLIQVKKTYTGSYTPPAGITVVADGAFRECTGLSGVTLPAKAQVIGHNTFGGCTSLSSIHIPAGVRYVHETAFANCSSLNTITLSAENPVFSVIGECLVYTPTRTLVVGTNRGSIPDDGRVTAIGSYAFSGRLGLQTLFIPTCVESVGYQALYGCTGLKDVYIGTAGVPAGWNVEWKEWRGTVHTGYTTDSRGIELTLSTDGTYYIITGMGTCTDTDVVLPAMRGGIFVKEIAEGAFKNNTAITSITLPPELVTVGKEAFAGCTSLTAVELPAMVKTVGNAAFDGCSALRSATFADPNSVKTLGTAAFRNCTSLSEFSIPAGIRELEAYTLMGCASLKSLLIPTGVHYIYNCALAGLNSLETLTVSSYNTIFHSNGNCVIETATKTLVAGCKTSVIPADGSVTSIGPCAFYELSTLTAVAIPSQVQTIDEKAFAYCTGLVSLDLGIGVSKLEASAFRGCGSLKTVVLPNSLKKVGYYAFASCDSLETAVIHKEVTNLQQGVFSGCEAMTNIYCGGKGGTWSDQWADNCPATVHWEYPLASQGLEFTLSEDGSYYILTGLGTCVDAAPRVPSVHNGLPVKEIGKSAFENKAITGIFLSEGLEVIGAEAFQACNDLRGINIPSTVKTVGDMAFYSCDSLTRFGGGESLEHIGIEAFAACNKLETVVLPPTVKTIGADAFGITKYRCGVKSVLITDLEAWCRIDFGDAGANPLNRGAALYVNEEWLTELTIPASVTEIKPYAFYGLNGVSSVTLPNGVTRVGTGAFAAGSMTTLTLNDGLTRIDNSAFSSCDYLVSVTIPQSVAYIGRGAFAYCIAMTDVHCGAASKPADWSDYWCFEEHDYGYNGRETLIHWAPWATYYKLSEDGTYYILQRADVRMPTDLEVLAEYNGLPVKAIAVGAFRNAHGLTGVLIPDTVESIGREAFLGCGNLTAVTLGTGVQLIDVDAFQDCEALESVYITDLKAFCRINVPGYDASPLYWADMLYLNGEAVTELVIPDGVESLACNFTGYKGLTGLVIPESVQEIGTSAFHSCVNLVTVEFPDTPVTVKEFAFTGCTSLKELTLKNGVVQTGVFKNCTSLERVYIHEGVTYIGYGAFEDCTAMTDMYCKPNAASQDWDANFFYKCPANLHWDWGKPQGTPGDVDGDGSITSTDARMTLQFYAGKIDENALNVTLADVDGDGQITSTDARLILQYYAGKIDRFPAQ